MQTIGERLEEARKKKGISIREAAEATKIRGDYLQKFESNHFDIGLTEIYTRGFLRTYANYLKLPADRIMNDYAALGRGEPKPRQPAREVYGRMDVSVAASETGDRAAAPADAPPPEPSPANRGPQRPRPGSSLPTGPDPAVVFKYVKMGGIAVIVVLLFWVLKALFFTGGTSPSTRPGQPVPRGPSFGLVATSPVQVTVRKKNPDGTEGDYLFSGLVSPGEPKTVARPGAVFIEANLPENLMLEINGRRIPLGVPRGELPAP
ncbi:MAG: helix-turn-helix domain-containing protein [Opitutaceae bacterium]